MKKAQEKNNESKPDVDKAKRVYRLAVDAIKRLDDVVKQRKAYREVFLQDAVGLRNKLKEYCERLMFYNPLEYGRKAEEVLWRKVFYQIIQLIKQNRKHLRPGSSLEAAFRTHLAAATGYYNHLLFRLQYEFSLNHHGLLDFHLVPEQKTGHRKTSSHNSRKRDVNPVIQDWATKACHRCLICLGDIARYQQDFDKGFSKAASERFYHQAVVLSPDNGMPHNQLGTLSGSRYLHCEAAYYYLRCLVCEKPFEGADGNLQRLFEKNRKRYQEMKQTSNHCLPSEPQSFHDLKVFLIQFLHLLDIFFDTTESTDPAELQENCQATLQSFNLCMFHEPDVYAQEDPRLESYQCLDDDMVFKLVVICMATIHLLQLRGSRQVTAATAFLLALYSHILNHVVMRLQAALDEKENPNKLLHTKFDVEADEEGDDLSDGDCDHPQRKLYSTEQIPPSLPNHHTLASPALPNHQENNDLSKNDIINEKKSKPARLKSLKRRRRRRLGDSSDSSDLSDVSDLSEGGDNLSDNLLSEDSEEEEFIGFFTNDSDSDLSDNLMESQELEPGFSSSVSSSHKNKEIESSRTFSAVITNGNNSAIWTDNTDNESLAHLSSELISSSMSFLRQSLKLSPQNSRVYENDVAEFEKCKDVIQGKKEVSVPPGFASSTEAKDVAELSNKLANFVIETDTEASIIPTDSEYSGADVEGDTDDRSSTSGSADKLEMDHHQLQYTLEVVYNEGLLLVVKVMCDWMRCNTSIIMTCAQSSQSLWHRLSVLGNILPLETSLAEHDQCWMEEVRNILKTASESEWQQVFPLREDINLWQFVPLAEVHSSLKLNIRRRGNMTEMQECFLRIGCIRQFCHFLSRLESLNFSYSEDQKVFIGPSQASDAMENEKAAMKRVADEESRRNQLMRDMAQLRLQAEVRQLEGSLETSDQGSFPPYLIPDTSSLCDNLHMVKQLTQTGKGIIIIPLSVIDTLDFLKKESGRAREAIRWLETEFRKGNRYIRAQKCNEKLQDSMPKNLKKKNRQMWCLNEILDCAMYLAQQGGDLNGGNIVAVLTSRELGKAELPPSASRILNEKEGVSLEVISAFTNKWKDIPKNKG